MAFEGDHPGARRVLMEPRISLGNVITLATIIVAIGMAWGQINGQVSALEKRIDDTKQQRAEDRVQTQNTIERIERANEKAVVEIKEMLNRFEAKLDRKQDRPLSPMPLP